MAATHLNIESMWKVEIIFSYIVMSVTAAAATRRCRVYEKATLGKSLFVPLLLQCMYMYFIREYEAAVEGSHGDNSVCEGNPSG